MEPLDSSLSSYQKPHHFLTLLAWVVVIAIGATAYLYHAGYFTYKSPPASNSSYNSVAGSDGYILVNLAMSTEPPTLYLYDIANKSLTPSTIQSFTPTASTDGRYIVGVTSTGVSNKTTQAIYEYDTTRGSMQKFASKIAATPYFPRLSPDTTSIVFDTPSSVGTSSIQFLYKPSFWNIFLVSRGGIPRVITHGTYPQWSPDGKSILYVSDDGLRQFTIASSTDTLVFKFQGGTVNYTMSLDVSKDGAHLTWTDPADQQLMVASITSWNPFMAHVDKIVPTVAVSPLFSPDGRRIIFEKEGNTSTAAGLHMSLFMLDTATYTITNIGPLSESVSSTPILSDWVEHL